MPAPIVIQADFLCSFKTGDNIKYNLNILRELYALYNEGGHNLLLKPIIILNASIVEAVLHDFHLRIKQNILEGVSSLTQDVIDHVRSKKIDEFEKYINQAQKHDFFDLSHTSYYKKLHTLREIRNRVHIQNTKAHEPKDEERVFTESVKVLSEKLLEVTLKTMSRKHFRVGVRNYVGEFVLPWEPHFQ